MRLKNIILALSFTAVSISCSSKSDISGDPKADGEEYAYMLMDKISGTENKDDKDAMYKYLLHEGIGDMGGMLKRGGAQIGNMLGAMMDAFGLNTESMDNFNEILSDIDDAMSDNGEISQMLTHADETAFDSTKMNQARTLLKEAIDFESKCEQYYKENTTEEEYTTRSGKYFDFKGYATKARAVVVSIVSAEESGMMSKGKEHEAIRKAFHPEEAAKEMIKSYKQKQHEDYEKWKNEQ